MHPFSTSDEDSPELIIYDNKEGNPQFATDVWHSDECFRERPAMGTFLCCKEIPEIGGDTNFASIVAIYESLSDRMQQFLSGLEAIYDFLPFKQMFPDRHGVFHGFSLRFQIGTISVAGSKSEGSSSARFRCFFRGGGAGGRFSGVWTGPRVEAVTVTGWTGRQRRASGSTGLPPCTLNEGGGIVQVQPVSATVRGSKRILTI